MVSRGGTSSVLQPHLDPAANGTGSILPSPASSALTRAARDVTEPSLAAVEGTGHGEPLNPTTINIFPFKIMLGGGKAHLI